LTSSRRPDRVVIFRALAPVLILALAGCASSGARLARTSALSGDSSGVELSGIPFFPQKEFQCGPAALATMLGATGYPVTPEALVPEVYTPGLSGSLQAEMLGAVRRRGLLPYELAPTLDALVAELVRGRPVLVLQNLRLESLPAWHYAVVIGADPKGEQLILRSGTDARLAERTGRFMRTWDLADRWAVVILHPGEMPADPDPGRYHRAVLGMEAAGRYAGAARAWQAALNIWPGDSVALFGLGNALYAEGDLNGARLAWERYVTKNPDDPAGLNNLAVALAESGCVRRGQALARAALAQLSRDDPLYADVLDTLNDLQTETAVEDPDYCRSPGDQDRSMRR
jgi:hypothetical protein